MNGQCKCGTQDNGLLFPKESQQVRYSSLSKVLSCITFRELIHCSSRNSVCYSLSFCLWVKINSPHSSLPGILHHSVHPGSLLIPHLSPWSCMKDMLHQYKVQCVLPILTGCGLEFLRSKGSQASWKRENWNMSWLLAPGLSVSLGVRHSAGLLCSGF